MALPSGSFAPFFIALGSIGAMGIEVPPPKPFSTTNGLIFSCVAKSSTTLPTKRKSHPLACVKSSSIVVCGHDVVDNVDLYQCCGLVRLFVGH